MNNPGDLIIDIRPTAFLYTLSFKYPVFFCDVNQFYGNFCQKTQFVKLSYLWNSIKKNLKYFPNHSPRIMSPFPVKNIFWNICDYDLLQIWSTRKAGFKIKNNKNQNEGDASCIQSDGFYKMDYSKSFSHNISSLDF